MAKNKNVPYIPQPYTFRLLDSRKEFNGYCRSPPFYLQLDHTLAVIWCIFSEKEADISLGINQFQWALEFLKSIVNKKGEYAKDIGICIQAIQDRLLSNYADMSQVLNNKTDNAISQSTVVSEFSFDRLNEGDSSEDLSYSNFKKQLTEQKESTESFIPFSINYSEMVKNIPADIQQLFKAKFSKVDVEDKSKTVSKASILVPDSATRESMGSFLRSWRQEQIEKIQAELTRLHSIETFMKTVDESSFTPIVADSTARELEGIESDKLKKRYSMYSQK